MERASSVSSESNKRLNIFDWALLVGTLIFLFGLIFHLVIKKVVPDPIGTYWKEILLGALVVILVIRSVLARQSPLTGTILDGAVLIYGGLVFIRFLLDGADLMASWGLYISILYLPIFFIVFSILRRFPAKLPLLTTMLVALGCGVALGGVIEFILNQALWPSAELTARQGFPDVYIYNTHLRRVYFVLDSPTTMANMLGLVLPLALSLFFTLRGTIARVAAGLASVLIFAGILLTFSRGIWVAFAVASVIMIIVKWLMAGNLAFIRTGIIIAVILVVIFAAVLMVLPGSDPDRYTIELSAEQYGLAPVTGSPTRILDNEPETGPVEIQNWTLYDAIARRDDTRGVIYSPPTDKGSSEVIYQVTVPESGALRFAIAMDPAIWTPEKGDGVNFRIFMKDVAAQDDGEMVFYRYINPKVNPSDRRWRNYVVDLSAWSNKTVNLSLITDAGPAQDFSYDWAGWADPQLVTVTKQFVAANRPSSYNQVLGHLTSIVDWSRDETNRDRLVAWSLAFSTWSKSPLWGTGLGTTGVAAFRTNPETAFVTESQFLKALVELGLLGLLVWGYLWYAIGRTVVRLYRQTQQPQQRMLILSIAWSLLIIFIASLVYQNMEVKQVNAIFWVFVGMLGYLAMKKNEIEQPEEIERS